MAKDVIDNFLDALRDAFVDTTREFTERLVAEQMPHAAPRSRVKAPKQPKPPKPPKAAKVKREAQGPTLYEILGVDRRADSEVIEAAWKAQARKYHPDKNKTASAAERMKAVNHAHDVLSDPTKRREYDRKLKGEAA